MVKHKFNTKYYIILCAFSLLLDCFTKEEQLFAAQCVWWLASIIEFTDILTYHHHCKIFPLDYLNNVVVTPLPGCSNQRLSVPETNVPALDISTDTLDNISNWDFRSHSSWNELLPNLRRNRQVIINIIRSG